MKKFTFETEREVDGRWIAEILEIPGVMAYGFTKQEAILRALEIAAEVESKDKKTGD